MCLKSRSILRFIVHINLAIKIIVSRWLIDRMANFQKLPILGWAVNFPSIIQGLLVENIDGAYFFEGYCLDFFII